MTDSADHEHPAAPQSDALQPDAPHLAGQLPESKTPAEPQPSALSGPEPLSELAAGPSVSEPIVAELAPITAEVVEQHGVLEQQGVAGHQSAYSRHASLPAGYYYQTPYRRRVWLPVALFAATCLSTFWAGTSGNIKEGPIGIFGLLIDPGDVIKIVIDNWQQGLAYMAAVMAILLAHEMGHFVQAVRNGVPASWPFFIPMPISPLGTMGAVIAMRGTQADRRELFDIGISGPIAGLLVAIPIAWIGISQATVGVGDSPMYLGNPLALQWMIDWIHPDLPAGQSLNWNPLYMAGWVGMLITGLNMMPISQLDGGHVAYALLGRGAHWLARGVVLAAALAIVITQEYNWVVMLTLVVLLGTDHPRTANDAAPIDWFRRCLGWASLLIPFLCFVPVPFPE